MQKQQLKHKLSLIVCIVLIAAMALFTYGCGDDNQPDADATDISTEQTTIQSGDIGKGEKEFTFKVVDVNGKETTFTVHTDKETVGEALIELEMIDGEDGAYGLYVKTVNGTTLDYDKDGKYWAFYVNGEYASAGVDSTAIEVGAVYSFKAE